MDDSAGVLVSLRPSRLISGWLAGLHAATLAPLWYSSLPVWAGIVISGAIAVHGAWAIRRFGLLRSPRSVVRIAMDTGAGCLLYTRDGARFSGLVDASSVVLGSLVVLAVKGSDGHGVRRTMIARDMLDDNDFRRLRVSLKWGSAHQP